jgi:hypothetical protein
MSPIIITPQEKTERLRTRLRTDYDRDVIAGYLYVRLRHRGFGDLTAEEQCTVLGQIAVFFREMAEQADSERLLIAEEELAA